MAARAKSLLLTGTVIRILFLLSVFTNPDTLRGQSDEIHDFISGNTPVHNQNWEICQDPVTGYLYFANSEGLVEYNGISSTIYHMPFRQGIRSVYVSSTGQIFSGSFEDFGYWEKDDEKGLIYQSLVKDITISRNDEIWNILENNGAVYFQSFTTIFKFDTTGVVAIPGPSTLLFMFRAGDKFIVQGLGRGLFWFDGSEFSFIPKSEMFSWLKVHAIVPRGRGVFWICTSNNGIFSYDGRSFEYMNGEISDFLKEATCNASLAIGDSLVVFGTILDGIVFCDQNGRIRRKFNFINGLSNNTILSLCKDADNGLWVGSDDGVNYIKITMPFTVYINSSGTLGTIYSVLKKDSSLYLGTNHGLFVADIRSDHRDYRFPGLRLIPNTQGQVWSLAEFDGKIMCGHNDGTFLIDKASASRISEVTGGWTMKPFNEYIIQGTYTGLVVLGKDNSGNWTFRNRVEGYREPTRYLETDYLGYIWAIHPQKGIDRLELNEPMDSVIHILHFNTIGNSTGKITMSQVNNQMVFMTSEYIYTFDYDKRSFIPAKSLEPGLGDYINATQITNYQKNNYWLILGNRIGLFEISKDLEAKNIIEIYHRYAELPGREQQIISLQENSLLIPTRQAFTIFRIDKLKENESTYSLSVSRLRFSRKNKTMTLTPGLSDLSGIPNRLNNLTVYLSNPSMFEKESQEYLYRIRELGDQWYRTSLDNFTFLNLKSGHYTLQVKTSSGTNHAELGFTIDKPKLISTPAILLYLLFIAALITLGVRIFRRSLDRHRKMIEYEVGKNRLETELDYKSYELMMTMRFLIRKTDVLRELHEKLDAMKEDSSRFPVKFIREMERIIDNGLDSQTEEWQNVMKNLKMSQEGFFRKLKEKFPTLTPNDLRMCSYLRMNFTTKEIANLINISTRAIEIGRYRLRKKMNLDHDVNLTEFLIKEAESVQ